MVESVVVIGYSIGRKKPVRPILFTSIYVNLISQSLLWVVLSFLFQHYLPALLIAEIFIWMLESAFLHSIPQNQLRFNDAMLLSLLMNVASFVLGWFLPT